MARLRVLVTGAFGYLGSALVQELTKEHSVVAFGHRPRNSRVMDMLASNVEVVFGNVHSMGADLADRSPFDAVVHLAGGGGADKCESDPMAAVRSNIAGTVAVLRCVGQHATRLLFASSIVVYGTHRDSERPYLETDATAADDLYGVLKESAEGIWTAFGGGTALRIANIYGAGIGVDVGLQGAVDRFARASAVGGEISVYGSGAQRIDYVHVSDVVAAFSQALLAPALPSVINIGGGKPASIADVAQHCVDAGISLGTAPTMINVVAPNEKIWPDRSLSIARAAEVLTWRPTMKLSQGLSKLVAMLHKEKA